MDKRNSRHTLKPPCHQSATAVLLHSQRHCITNTATNNAPYVGYSHVLPYVGYSHTNMYTHAVLG